VNDTHAQLCRQALPWDGDSVVQFYLDAHPTFPYRERFAQLFIEAYHAFLAGCPRASMVISGEALLRAIYERIIQWISTGNKLTVSRSRRPLSLEAGTPTDVLFGLADELSFCQAIDALKETKAFSEDDIHLMLVVKDLRNAAAHRELPILDEWDPKDPRPSEELTEMLWNDSQPSEGYRFIPSRQRSDWFAFDPRKYKCGSLRPLSVEDRFAAIQYLLVLESVAKMRG
jgi:hypothetical protein